jgi:hypothetical protein
MLLAAGASNLRARRLETGPAKPETFIVEGLGK